VAEVTASTAHQMYQGMREVRSAVFDWTRGLAGRLPAGAVVAIATSL